MSTLLVRRLLPTFHPLKFNHTPFHSPLTTNYKSAFCKLNFFSTWTANNPFQDSPLEDPIENQIHSTACKNIYTILTKCIKPSGKLLVIYDEQCSLTKLIANAYQTVSSTYPTFPSTNTPPHTTTTTTTNPELSTMFINFDQTQPNDILEVLNNGMGTGDTVVLVQSMAMQYAFGEYRMRLELFRRGMKNIEHVHLKLLDSSEHIHYVNALGFDPVENKPLALWLKNKLDNCKKVVVTSKGGSELVYDTKMEPSLLNTGDYTGNIGGTFPIGEVFTEASDLTKVNGEVELFAFPNIERKVEFHKKSWRVRFEKGNLVWCDPTTTPASFQHMLDLIREGETEATIREFGVGLNRAMGKNMKVTDVTAFERQLGLHFSVGKKHTVFKKAGMKSKARFHMDIFVDVNTIVLDEGDIIFEKGDFTFQPKK